MPIKKKRYQYLLLVGLPSVLALVYFLFLATGMYISEARFSLRSAEGGTGGSELLALLGQSANNITSDAFVLRDYIHSADMLTMLDTQLGLRDHYTQLDADHLSRLDRDATFEEFLAYYRKVVEIGFDAATGILTLRVRAYTPEMAQKAAGLIVELSENMVNTMRDRALADSLLLARSELERAEQRVAAAREALKVFRGQRNQLNPEATAGALLGLVAQLEEEVARTRTELAEARAFMREDSARIVALNARIEALQAQIKTETARLTGADHRAFNEILSEYEGLLVEREFAEKLYVSALSSLEAARIQAQAQSRYLVTFAAPTLPDEAVWPRRLLSSFLFFAAASLIYGVIALIIAAIREHAGY